jgi:hypothetical protein
MLPSRSKLIPVLFWIGFVALGFLTSFAAPNNTRPDDNAYVAGTGGRR